MLTDNTNNILRRLLLAPLVLFGLASIIATGGGSGPGSEDDGDLPAIAVTVSEETVSVARGSTVRVRVDVDGLPADEGVAGYTIDLSETASRIDIQTTPCPAGAGTLSCQDWSITPAADAIPGFYELDIEAAGTFAYVAATELHIDVVGALPPVEPARIAEDRLIITADGRLWAHGLNFSGQAGVGFQNGCNEPHNRHCVQPLFVNGYVQVGERTDWIEVASTADSSLAVSADGTAWIWGKNFEGDLGFETPGERQFAPAQVPGLPPVRRVSISASDDGFLALTTAGEVYVWGNAQRAAFVDGQLVSGRAPRRVPQAVTPEGVETPLSGVIDIAGGTAASGHGFALALKADGSVWQWGSDSFYYARNTATQSDFIADSMPSSVAGLPPVAAIAAGSRDGGGADGDDVVRDYFAVAATRNGEVYAWDIEAATPRLVPGLGGIVSVSADLFGAVAALGADGTVWRWEYAESSPLSVSGAPAMVHLAKGAPNTVVAGDCSSTTGSLWATTLAGEATRRPRFGMGCQPPAEFRLSVVRTGDGAVLTDPEWLNCPQTCSADLPAGTQVDLLFMPAPGWRRVVSEAGDDCAGFLTLVADHTCAARFEARPPPVTLAISITGGGRVVSEPAGIDCPGECTRNYPSEGAQAVITLRPRAAPGYRFASFGGDSDCTPDGIVTMSTSRQCNALFEALPAPAAPTGLVATPGNDAVRLDWNAVTDGSVTGYRLQRSEGGGAPIVLIENMGGGASAYRDNTVVPGREYTYRLTASNVSGSSPPATVTALVPSASSVTLTVQVSGPGRVTSSPAGIDCPGDCVQSYSLVSNVTLTASANANARFDGWGGSCAGTAPTAVVTTDDNRTCTATFASTSAGGWVTLASDIASSFELNLHSSVALSPSGLGFVAYLQTVNTQGVFQNRLSVRRITTGFPPLGQALNATANWSATSPQLVIDGSDTPLMIFCADLSEIWVARWNGSSWSLLPPDPNVPAVARLNLTPSTGTRPRMVRSGNTLIAAWMENQRIAVRRYDLVTQQWDAGAFIPTPTNPFDIDLAVDQNGLAIVAWSDGLLGTRLQATRETAPGTWVALGGEIGTRPQIAPMVLEFGVHVDTGNTIRIVWVEGDTNFFVQLAQFDGANWAPLPGRTETRFQQGSERVRTLHVNHEPALFAFAYAVDSAGTGDSSIVVQQLLGNSLVSVGSEFQTTHPQIGDLSFSMLQPHAATMAQSQFTPAGPVPYRLAVRRHNPL